MRPRKSKDVEAALLKKGFRLEKGKQHHRYYVLYVDGKMTTIRTYISHGSPEYGKALMSAIKKQMKFSDNSQVEKFFDCPMSAEDYAEMLKKKNEL